MSIPHDELHDDPAQSVTVDPGSVASLITEMAHASDVGQDEAANTANLTTEISPVIRAQPEAWYLRYGRVMPPCATTASLQNLYENAKAGIAAHWVHKSGESPSKRSLYLRVLLMALPSSVIQLGRTWKSQEVLANMAGVGGEDKNGFELQLSAYKVFKMATKIAGKAKSPIKTANIRKRGFGGN